MARLVALDLPLGPQLEAALRDAVASATAFCVVDPRLSPRGRERQLARFGATHVRDADGVSARSGGVGVDAAVGLVALTSGSSGEPKAVELSWDALAASARLTSAALARTDPTSWFPCLPATHVGGAAVILRAIFADARLVWGDVADPASGPAAGATHVAVVATQLARADLSGYRVVLLGGGRPPATRAANVVATWGLTETGSGIVYDGVALPEVDVAAVGGELVVRSPTLCRGYRDAPLARATGPDGRDDWFPTGDGGEVVDGRVRVFGRLGFVITTGGEKVWPEDLESVLARVRGVRDVAVTGVPDAEWGERVVALIVDDGGTSDDDLRHAADESLGPWAKPKEIRRVAALPRTGQGKLRRGDLSELY
ncbi:MAG: AMP-binding enzyme [Acidimicrobiales bacterium]